jgi:hypothetical protein
MALLKRLRKKQLLLKPKPLRNQQPKKLLPRKRNDFVGVSYSSPAIPKRQPVLPFFLAGIDIA